MSTIEKKKKVLLLLFGLINQKVKSKILKVAETKRTIIFLSRSNNNQYLQDSCTLRYRSFLLQGIV